MKFKKNLKIVLILFVVNSCTVEDSGDFNNNLNNKNESSVTFKNKTADSKNLSSNSIITNVNEDEQIECIYRSVHVIYKYSGGLNEGEIINNIDDVLLERSRLSKIYTPTNSKPCPIFKIPAFPNIRYDKNEGGYIEKWKVLKFIKTHGTLEEVDVDPDDEDLIIFNDNDSIGIDDNEINLGGGSNDSIPVHPEAFQEINFIFYRP